VAKLVFPMAAVMSNIINFLLSLIPLVILIAALRFPFHWTWIYIPFAMISLLLFTLGACFFFATANVFYRDVSHIIQIILSAWFYFTPVIYSLDLIPEKYRWLFHLNPMVYVLNGFRLGIYYGRLPSMQSMAIALLCGILSLIIGFSVFRRYENIFVYYI
jgi:ABC-type polysaccharide/polyol phosphate export permease